MCIIAAEITVKVRAGALGRRACPGRRPALRTQHRSGQPDRAALGHRADRGPPRRHRSCLGLPRPGEGFHREDPDPGLPRVHGADAGRGLPARRQRRRGSYRGHALVRGGPAAAGCGNAARAGDPGLAGRADRRSAGGPATAGGLVHDGRHRDAAAFWTKAGGPYKAAWALLDSNDEVDLREARALFDRLGAPVLVERTDAKLRSIGARVPRGARPSTRANVGGLTAASSTSSSCSTRACATPRSPSGCSCPRRPCTITSRRSWPSSASRRGSRRYGAPATLPRWVSPRSVPPPCAR